MWASGDKNIDNITETTIYKPERKEYVAPVAPVLIRSSDKEEKKTVKSPEIFKEASHCDNSNGHLCKQMSGEHILKPNFFMLP